MSSEVASTGLILPETTRVHHLADGHLHAAVRGELEHGGQGVEALDHGADPGDGLVHGHALAEHPAAAQVAAVEAARRDHEVAGAGQPEEGLLVAAERGAQAAHLRQAARDERRGRVVAEAQAARDAAREGDDVLDGAAELDALDVRAGVDAQDVAREEPLDEERRLGVVARRHDARGHVERDLLGVAGAGERHGDGRHVRARLRDLGGDDLGHRVERALLEALRRADEDGVGAQVRRGLRGHRAHEARRGHEHDHVLVGRRVPDAGGEGYALGERGVAGQRDGARGAQAVDHLLGLGPDGDVVPLVREEPGEGEAPRAAAEHANLDARRHVITSAPLSNFIVLAAHTYPLFFFPKNDSSRFAFNSV